MKELNSITVRRFNFNTWETITVSVGNDCFIGRCGSFRTVFGENGKVTKITDKYIYCTSESGSIVKYDVKKNNTIGKWRAEYYFINLNTTRDYGENVIKDRPHVWNDKKCQIEYK